MELTFILELSRSFMLFFDHRSTQYALVLFGTVFASTVPTLCLRSVHLPIKINRFKRFLSPSLNSIIFRHWEFLKDKHDFEFR